MGERGGRETAGTGAPGLPLPRRYLAIVSISAGSILLMVDASISSVALPTIAERLGVPSPAAVLVVTVYQLLLAMTIMPFSALGERVGHRRLYRIGLLVHVAAGAACLLAHSLPVLLLVRSVQALSAAAALGVAFGMVRAIYPPSQIGRGLGLNTLAAASGSAAAPAIGGLILAVAPWQWVFAAGAPLALLSLALGRALPDSGGGGARFDVGGAGLCAATFGLLIAGSEGLTHGAHPGVAVGTVAAGIAVACIFVAHQRRQREPVLPVDLLASPAFGLATASSYVAVLASSTLIYTLPFRLHEVYGFSPAETGAMLAPYAVASVMIAPTAGMLSDRISPKRLSTIGISVGFVALLLTVRLPAHPGFLDIAWRTWLCGAGISLFSSPNARMVIAAAPLARAASAGGLIATTRMISQATGATITGALLALGTGPTGVPSLVAVGFAAITLLLTIARPAVARPAATPEERAQGEIADAELAGS